VSLSTIRMVPLLIRASSGREKGQATGIDYARAGGVCQMVALALEMGYNFLAVCEC
jgi:hypothetical protein